MSSVVAIIQARLGSTRLPEKILADVGGKPLIRQVVDRARAIEGIDDWVVAVPHEATRLLLQPQLPDVRVFAAKQAHQDDVLGRFAEVARQFPSHDRVLRLTADCPLLIPALAEDVLAAFADEWDFVTNASDGYIDGTDAEVFSVEALLLADAEADTAFEREHVTPWMKQNLRATAIKPTVQASWLKTSVDDPDDLERVRLIMARLADGDYSLAGLLTAAKAAKAVA